MTILGILIVTIPTIIFLWLELRPVPSEPPYDWEQDLEFVDSLNYYSGSLHDLPRI